MFNCISPGRALHTLRTAIAQAFESLTFGRSAIMICVLLAVFSAMMPELAPSIRAGKENNLKGPSTKAPTLMPQVGERGPCAVALSPDGKWLFDGGASCAARLWDIKAGRVLRVFGGHSHWVECMALSSDSKWLFTGSDDYTARMWDVQSGEMKRVFESESKVTQLAVSPDGKRLATGENGTAIDVWDVNHAAVTTRIDEAEGLRGMAFSKDGKRIFAALREGGDEIGIGLWDSSTGKLIRKYVVAGARPREFVDCMSLSQDGKWLVAGGRDKRVRLWDVESGRQVKILGDHALSVDATAISGDSRRIATAAGTSVTLWDLETGKKVRMFKTIGEGSLSFSADGKLLAAGGALWDVETGAKQAEFLGDNEEIWPDAMSCNGKWLVTTDLDGNGRVWDLTKGTPVWRFRFKDDYLRRREITNDGRHVLVAARERLELWDTSREKAVVSIGKEQWTWPNQALSSDGRWLLAHNGHDVRVWDTKDGRQKLELREVEGTVTFATFWNEGNGFFAVTSDGRFTLWDRETGKVLKQATHGHKATAAAALTNDGKRLITASEDTLQIWDMESKSVVKLFKDCTPRLWALSPDERWIAIGRGTSALLYPLHTGDVAHELDTYSGSQFPYSLSLLAFTRDGKNLVTANWRRGTFTNGYIEKDTVRVWDVGNGKERASWTFSGSTEFLFLSADGKRLVGVDHADRTMRILDLGTGRESCRLIGFENDSWAVLAPDGRYDGANGGRVAGLHWVIGNQSLPLGRFRDQYYSPGLLAECFGLREKR